LIHQFTVCFLSLHAQNFLRFANKRVIEKFMRFFTAAILSVIAIRGRAEEYDGWEEDDDLITVETQENESAEEPEIEEPPRYEEDTTLAERADENLTDSERKMRMAMCIGIARERFMSSEEEMKQAVEMMKTLHQMEEDQAREMIHINMIKNCYLNFNEKEDIPTLTAGENDEEKYKSVVNRLIAPPLVQVEGKQQTLLERQWELIRQVVEDERTRQTAQMGGKIEVIGSKMSGFNKFLYFVSVFAAIFGGGYFLVRKLMALEAEKMTKKKESKSAKKQQRESSQETATASQKKDQ